MNENRADRADWKFRGFCLNVPKQKDYEFFRDLLELFPEYNCNTLVFLIRYAFKFKSHPEVADGEPLTAAQVKEIVSLCRKNKIRIIPKMNLFGHQSEKNKGTEQGLLRAYPEFDETPDDQSVRYCRSICPRHPKVKETIFELADEIIEAFEADAIHIGCDEVFEIGKCPRCRTSSNSELFAEWINGLHGHFVAKSKLEMFMWGDRLLDASATGYGEWEASSNNTWQDIDKIPKDIVICDWHYNKLESYPSIPFFQEKGFRVIASPWKEIENTKAFLEYSKKNGGNKFLGVLQTSWNSSGLVANYIIKDGKNVDETATSPEEIKRAQSAMSPEELKRAQSAKLAAESFKFSMEF